jgi:hypothetical protein
MSQDTSRRLDGGHTSRRHYTVLLCIQLFESTAKTTTSVTKAVAASSATLLAVTAETVVLTVGSEDGFREGEHMPGRSSLATPH